MIDREKLLGDLKGELSKLEADILQYSERHAELGQHLKEQYQKAVEAGRTAEHFVAWREAQITQAAAAWVLTCVFVRFLEDNGLLEEPVLSGPASRADHTGITGGDAGLLPHRPPLAAGAGTQRDRGRGACLCRR